MPDTPSQQTTIIDALLESARHHVMTPAEHHAQWKAYVMAEAGFGLAKDEKAFRAAWASDDRQEMARLQAESDARRDRAAAVFERMGL